MAMPYWAIMAARDRWTLNLKCKACGTEGVAEVSEDDHPYMAAEGTFSVDRVPEGFRVRELGGTSLATVFECSKCGGITDSG